MIEMYKCLSKECEGKDPFLKSELETSNFIYDNFDNLEVPEYNIPGEKNLVCPRCKSNDIVKVGRDLDYLIDYIKSKN